ncbi:MAG: diacylglycerol kinase family protein [candidate division KSB1 bacterium]|jgi:diacylglycerol kinase (ATP)|nr:diacylglycerol kinase family protein [candidate division KSB1 bacterium]
MKNEFSIHARIKSFQYAFNGIGILIRSQHNAWIHAAATIIVIVTGILVELTISEWRWIAFAIITVWIAEAFNTAIEFLADAAVKELHPLIEKAKDVAAAAVLIAAIGSVIIGILVIGPRLLQ